MIRRSTAPTTWTDWRKSSTFEHVFIYMESFCASPQVKQDRGVDAASASEQDFNCIRRQGIYNILECNAMQRGGEYITSLIISLCCGRRLVK